MAYALDIGGKSAKKSCIKFTKQTKYLIKKRKDMKSGTKKEKKKVGKTCKTDHEQENDIRKVRRDQKLNKSSILKTTKKRPGTDIYKSLAIKDTNDYVKKYYLGGRCVGLPEKNLDWIALWSRWKGR